MMEKKDKPETDTTKVSEFQCVKCELPFVNNQELMKHLAYGERLPEKHLGNKLVDLKCTICDQNFDDYSLYTNHFESHSEDDSVGDEYKCSDCSGVFQNITNLELQKVSNHNQDSKMQDD